MSDEVAVSHCHLSIAGSEIEPRSGAAVVEIAEAARRGVPHYYLGYWVEGARTMEYKADYRPHEVLRDGVWKRDDPGPDADANGRSDDVPN